MSDLKRPLEGVVVIDFTRVYSGPYCTMMLADLGAEVIKIERKGVGDDSRKFLPLKDDSSESGYFMYLNRNKKSIELDLRTEESREIIYRLCEKADVVVENFSPGVTNRLGVDYDTLKKYNGKIIYGSISGFGQTGPYKDKLCYDIVAQAMGGYMAISGFKDGPPMKLGTCIADAVTGIHMAYAISSALYYRENSGVGQYIDVAMMDTVFSTLENFVVMKTHAGITSGREGNSNIGAAPFNVYITKDSYVAIAIANDTLFSKFAHALKREDLLETDMFKGNKSRKENEEMLNSIINEWSADKTTKEICKLMDEVGVPVGPILGMDELVEDPQIKERDMLVEMNHPTEGKFVCPGNPIKYSLSSISQFQPAPLLGANSREVLEEYGGYSLDEINKFKDDGVI